MASEILKRDQDKAPVAGAVTNDVAQDVKMLRVDPTTGRLLVDAAVSITKDTVGAAVPSTADTIGMSDGTNVQVPRVFDVDSGAGTQYVTGANLRISASGGSIEAKGQQTMANSIPVALASDQASIPVTLASTIVTGNIASAGADSGNPVKVGGKYNSTQPTFTDGQRGDLQLTARGSVATTPYTLNNGSPIDYYADNADGVAVTTNQSSQPVIARNTIFNGTSYDRVRSIINATDSVGTGIAASGILGQFDDTSPGTVTENRFGNIRMSVRREVYVQLRDAAGNERGLNIDSNGAIAITVASIPSHAVTNAGTFAVQATPVTQADTFMLGGVNIKEINAVTPLMGNGATGTGSQRITLASDNSAVALWGHGATGSAVPANAVLNGISDAGTMRGVLQAANALNSTGTGLPTAQLVGQFDDVSPTAITENQFGNIRMSANRNVYQTIRDAAGNERGVNVTAGNALSADLTSVAGTAIVTGGTAGTQGVGGIVANNGTINSAVNPVLIGGQAVSSENAANTTAKLSQFVTDLVGKQIVLPYANPENFVSARATATDTTSTSLLGAPASGLRNYITQITVWNASAVNSYIKIQDGSGGTELYDIPCPAGGGATITFPTPLRQPTTATAIFFAANASMNAVFISASGYKGI